MKLLKKISFLFGVVVLLSLNIGCETSAIATQSVQYENPSWAPAYSLGVRYYYLPDIEAYYDLSNRDFVYLNNGQWLFSNDLPRMYSDYDLNSGFAISLNSGVYQPWMHHQYYVSNYPRYYYRNVYKNYDDDGIRGFNENEHKPFYRNSDNRNKTYGVRTNDKPKEIFNKNDDAHRNAPSQNAPTFSRQPQNTNYYGKNIGQPVIVRPNMRENRPQMRQQAAPQSRPQIRNPRG